MTCRGAELGQTIGFRQHAAVGVDEGIVIRPDFLQRGQIPLDQRLAIGRQRGVEVVFRLRRGRQGNGKQGE